MALVGTQIAAVDAEMPWGAAVSRMVLCGSVSSAVSTDGVTDQPQQMASATVWASLWEHQCVLRSQQSMLRWHAAAVWEISRSLIEHLMEHLMEHSVCSVAVVSECSPPPDV